MRMGECGLRPRKVGQTMAFMGIHFCANGAEAGAVKFLGSGTGADWEKVLIRPKGKKN
jgi:hypothetical protein